MQDLLLEQQIYLPELIPSDIIYEKLSGGCKNGNYV
jgi:hypothetical protein